MWEIKATVPEVKSAILDHLATMQAARPETATLNDYYQAISYAVRDLMMRCWTANLGKWLHRHPKTMAYLSAEYLLGPQLGNNLLNLGLLDLLRESLAGFQARGRDVTLERVLAQEEEPGLGNGGLGRLAACFLDSAASLGVPAMGYGLRYEFGIFRQEITDGWQEPITDKWLHLGFPWEIPRPEKSYDVRFSGYSEWYRDSDGETRVRWKPDHVVKGTAYDVMFPGYRNGVTSILRLFKAEATESFDFRAFNVGDYYGAVHEKMVSENITKVLYPNDEPQAGKLLRLQQQYFLVSCALQDVLQNFFAVETDIDRLPERFALQLNDTHPAVAVAELMRLLLDEYDIEWERAWDITGRTFSYTNHTLLPEALEKWSVGLFGKLLPRHLEIVYEINRRFLNLARSAFPNDGNAIRRLSLIDETGERYIRMANLATVGSHAVNGVARLHTDLLQKTVLGDFHALWPERFHNVTNGVTPRRFLLLANPGLAGLITEAVGEGWERDLDRLEGLVPFAEDAAFLGQWRRVKVANKGRLAHAIAARTGIVADPASLFDVQAKRIHEYKRQHLNLLHVISLFNRIRRGETDGLVPRTVVFGGKAAPGYHLAQLIIKLVHSVAEVVHNAPETGGLLRIVFFPDFNVKNSELVYPAADLSEQISTAGKEASGTGNMKFSLNGALTIGTLDGANIEIREAVGEENFFLFGMDAEQVQAARQSGYRPAGCLEAEPELHEAFDQIASGYFSGGDRNIFRPLVDSLLFHDEYMVLADFHSYAEAQRRVAGLWSDPAAWARKSVLNVARMGRFSSDRAVLEYCRDIWGIAPLAK